MKKRNLFIAAIAVMLMSFFSSPTWAQNLSEVYVSPSGNVLGCIMLFNPGFSSQIFVNGPGLLVWVDMEIPNGMVEVYSDGYIRLLEQKSSYNTSYESGRIHHIGDLRFYYDQDGRISKIGDLSFAYENGQLYKIGDIRITYESGRIRNIGDLHFIYESGRIRKIGKLDFFYDENGRIRNIGGARFEYDYGSLREVKGNIPGVSINIATIVEFRKRIGKSW